MPRLGLRCGAAATVRYYRYRGVLLRWGTTSDVDDDDPPSPRGHETIYRRFGYGDDRNACSLL